MSEDLITHHDSNVSVHPCLYSWIPRDHGHPRHCTCLSSARESWSMAVDFL